MNAAWIIIAIVAIVIFKKLFSVLGKEPATEKFRGVLPGTGQVFEMTISKKDEREEEKKEAHIFDEFDFLLGAKMAFNAVVDAFANGNKEILKPLVSKRVFDIFALEIDKRASLNQKMEFSLISIETSKILSKDNEKKPTRVTVEMVTEQMNVLRDKDGAVLEGDPIQISKVKDTWTFKKENGLRATWIVTATKSEAV